MQLWWQVIGSAALGIACAQAGAAQRQPSDSPQRVTLGEESAARQQNVLLPDGSAVLRAGLRIPLRLLNTVSSKNAAPGSQVYLQTIVPVFVEKRLVIPAGSHVTGTIHQAKRAGKAKGKGQLYLTFDTLLLPTGAQVDLRSRLSGVDGAVRGRLEEGEGKVSSEAGASRDAQMVAGAAVGGTMLGGWIGGQGRDAAIGAGAGAAAGLAAVLLTRGPEAVLPQGAVLEMALERDLVLRAEEWSGRATSEPLAPR